MLNHTPFYHEHFKKYVSVFGTLFNDIVIERKNKLGVVEKTIKVPLSFMNKDKILERLQQDPELMNTWNPPLPRMAFWNSGLSYDPRRKTNSVNYYAKDANGVSAQTQFSPSPYDISFTLGIWTHYFEDALQIVEQILPFFQPDYVVTVKEVPQLNIEKDIPITLDSVTYFDQVEGDFNEERVIEWELTFTLKGYFFGPVQDRAIIKTSTATNYFEPDFSGSSQSTNWAVSPITAMKDDPGMEIIKSVTET